MPGTIVIKPLSANLTRNTELFGTMDPYCKFVLGKQKIEGQVCRNGGKHPHWEDTLKLRRNNEPVCQLELKEKDWLLPDGLIGECQLNLKEVEDQKRVLKWFPLSFQTKPVGKILLEVSYEPDHTIAKADDKIQQVEKFQPVYPQEHKPSEPISGVIHGWTPFIEQVPTSHQYQPQSHPQIQPYGTSYPQPQYIQPNIEQSNTNMYAPPASMNYEDPSYPQKYPQFDDQQNQNPYGDNQYIQSAQPTTDYQYPSNFGAENGYNQFNNEVPPNALRRNELTGNEMLDKIRGAYYKGDN